MALHTPPSSRLPNQETKKVLEFQPNPPPPLTLPTLKHDLRRHEQHDARRGQKGQAIPRAHQRLDHALQPVDADGKPDQIRRHHHQDVAHRADPADDAIRLGSVLPSRCRECHGGEDLGDDEEGDEPAPHQETEVDVVPEGDEGEDGERVQHTAELAWALTFPGSSSSTTSTTTKWHVDVPHDPAVETSVPTPPEGKRRVVIAHAPDHVLGRVGSVEKSPETEEAEWD